MTEPFVLTVNHKDKDIDFPAQFLRTGYSYKIQVDIYGVLINFEPDEERNWRAITDSVQLRHERAITPELLQAIATSLEEISS
jgi:hypothetical protein